MKQRIKIKQYKKELSIEIDFFTESFFYWLNNTDKIDRISLKICPLFLFFIFIFCINRGPK